jgi:hypothetical protein
VTDGSYAHWWYLHVRNAANLSAAGPLERRSLPAGTVRVRGSAEFALQYGWVLAMFVPLALSLAIERARRVLWAVPAVLVAAIVLSVSRSVFLGLTLAGLAWLVSSRFDRRVALVVAGGAVVAGGLFLGIPSLRHPYHGAPADSIQSRVRRQQIVAAAVVPRPYTGVGLAGLNTYGLSGTDSMYVQTYGTLGIVGVLGLGAILLTPLVVAAGAAIRGRDLVAAGAAGGVVAGIVAAGAFDSLSGPTSAWALWLVAGIGVAAADAHRAARRWRVSPVRAVVPVAGVLAGLAATAVVSPRASTISRFTTIDPRYLGALPGDPAYPGSIVVNTVCDAGKQVVKPLGASIICQGGGLSGEGFLVIGARNRATVSAALARFDAIGREVTEGYTRTEITRFYGRSTPVKTAPVSLGVGGLLLVVLVPPLLPIVRGEGGHGLTDAGEQPLGADGLEQPAVLERAMHEVG